MGKATLTPVVIWIATLCLVHGQVRPPISWTSVGKFPSDESRAGPGTYGSHVAVSARSPYTGQIALAFTNPGSESVDLHTSPTEGRIAWPGSSESILGVADVGPNLSSSPLPESSPAFRHGQTGFDSGRAVASGGGAIWVSNPGDDTSMVNSPEDMVISWIPTGLDTWSQGPSIRLPADAAAVAAIDPAVAPPPARNGDGASAGDEFGHGLAASEGGDTVVVSSQEVEAVWAFACEWKFTPENPGVCNFIGGISSTSILPSSSGLDTAIETTPASRQWTTVLAAGRNFVAVGCAQCFSGSGSVILFGRKAGADYWTATTVLNGQNIGGNEGGFGASVAVCDDNTLLVGAPGFEASNSTGSVFVFARQDGDEVSAFLEVRKLGARVASVGDRFGYTVACSGSVALVGAPGTRNDGGAVLEFDRHGKGRDTWDEDTPIPWNATVAEAPAGSLFGSSIAMGPNVAAISDRTSGGAVHAYYYAPDCAGTGEVILPVDEAAVIAQLLTDDVSKGAPDVVVPANGEYSGNLPHVCCPNDAARGGTDGRISCVPCAFGLCFPNAPYFVTISLVIAAPAALFGLAVLCVGVSRARNVRRSIDSADAALLMQEADDKGANAAMSTIQTLTNFLTGKSAVSSTVKTNGGRGGGGSRHTVASNPSSSEDSSSNPTTTAVSVDLGRLRRGELAKAAGSQADVVTTDGSASIGGSSIRSLPLDPPNDFKG